MNRVFICGAFSFPRGGAASNYVQYLGMALKECGYEVHIVSLKNSEYSGTSYKGLIINEIRYHLGKIKHHIDFKTGLNRTSINCLKSHKIEKDDIVIIYSHNLWLHQSVKSYCRKNGVEVGAVVVEYFSAEQFSKKIDYVLYQRLIKKVIPNYDFIFPISTYIEEKLSFGRARQMVLPIMADPYEYKHKEKVVEDTRRFIFPAKGKMKDALENMVLAIGEILRKPEADVEFHFCGVKKDDICKVLKISDEGKLDSRIIVHEWLEYKDLIELYQKMDFLLLARDINEMTKANFPSKVPEVMSYGVIPVASRVGDYTKFYLVNGENSILMDGCSVNEIKQTIEKCIKFDSNMIRKLSNQAYCTATDRFYYKKWIEKIDAFLKVI